LHDGGIIGPARERRTKNEELRMEQ
jgi:hypothetical protein